MTSDAHQALTELSHRILDAILRRDRPVLDAVLLAEFVQINEAGVRTNRSAFLAAVCDGDMDITDLTFDSLSTEVFGEIGIVSGVQRGRVRLASGEYVTGRTAFTDVFVKQNGAWKLRVATSADLP